MRLSKPGVGQGGGGGGGGGGRVGKMTMLLIAKRAKPSTRVLFIDKLSELEVRGLNRGRATVDVHDVPTFVGHPPLDRPGPTVELGRLDEPVHHNLDPRQPGLFEAARVGLLALLYRMMLSTDFAFLFPWSAASRYNLVASARF